MSLRPTDPNLFDHYLNILGVPKREPSFNALTELVEAHLVRVPFESISKLYYKKHVGLSGLPDLELYLDGIERYNFGGTCYPNNIHLNQLLAHLGYRVRLCGADMNNPDVHVVSMVDVEGREYLVDAGYAAPFLAPLPRDLTDDHIVTSGRDRFVLTPQDADGCSRVDMYRDGNLKHGYLAKPAPREIKDFEQIIADSFRRGATFMNALLLARFYPNRSCVIHNLNVVDSVGSNWKTGKLTSRGELAHVVEDRFSIPRHIVADAVAELGELGDPWT